MENFSSPTRFSPLGLRTKMSVLFWSHRSLRLASFFSISFLCCSRWVISIVLTPSVWIWSFFSILLLSHPLDLRVVPVLPARGRGALPTSVDSRPSYQAVPFRFFGCREQASVWTSSVPPGVSAGALIVLSEKNRENMSTSPSWE